MPKTDKPAIAVRKISEFEEGLPCLLTHEEVEEKRKLALEAHKDIVKVKLDLEYTKQRYKTRIKELESKFQAALNSADSGREDRKVPVEDVLTNHGTVERRRLDTGEVLHTRKATAAELNEFLPGTEPDPKKVGEAQQKPKKRGKDAAAEQGEDW